MTTSGAVPHEDPAPARAAVERAVVERAVVRVVLLDPDDRLLLFRSVDERTGRSFWHLPGGGAEPGETPARTAARELREETGLTEVVLGPELWRRRRPVTRRGVPHLFRERHYLGRTVRTAIDTSGFSEQERRTVLAHRWWTAAELAATSDHLAPADLAALLARLLAQGPPPTPFRLDT